jgi:hypothetical protein
MRHYIDFEFDGHGGPILSVGIVSDHKDGMHATTRAKAQDKWVVENVVPLMNLHHAPYSFYVDEYGLGGLLRHYLGADACPTIVADSPVDIWRFCQCLSTSSTGGWASAEYPQILFEVHNVDCYPTAVEGAVQHNAWWDAVALREKLKTKS